MPEIEKINLYTKLLASKAELFRDDDLSSTARTNAVNDVTELDSNWLENLAGVKGTLTCITPLIMGYKAFLSKDYDLMRRSLSGAYLAYCYVIKPGLNDIKNINKDGKRILRLATANRFSLERRRGIVQDNISLAGVDASRVFTTTFHLRCKTDFLSQIWVALEKLGIEPSAAQLWDCVPLSFVLDWFLKIGDNLRTLSNYESLLVHREVQANIEGFKVQWAISESDIDLQIGAGAVASGNSLVYSFYHRVLRLEVGPIDPISSNLGNGLTLSQLTQGAALITQMKRR